MSDKSADSTSSSVSRLTGIARHFSSPKPKIVVCRALAPEPLEPITAGDKYEVVMWPKASEPASKEWLAENVKGATGILCMLSEKINGELLDAAGPSLRVVSTMSVGFDHADLNALATRNIRFGYTPDVLTDAVADITVMLALMASRNIREHMQLIDKNEWPSLAWSPFALCGTQISLSPLLTDNLPTAFASRPKRVMGFLGFGRIARASLARLIPFGVTDVIFTGNPSSPPSPTAAAEYAKEFPTISSITSVPLDTLFKESDVLFILAPSTPATYHIVNEERLRTMKPSSILINTARGTLVDSDALAKALREKWIWGAGLDVVEGEPKVPADHVLVKEPRCVVLPHVGSATIETRMGMAGLAVRNVLAGVEGKEMGAELDLSRYK